ncbi:MAG: SgcJ/EcaC family oxidoreductase [Anaerolineae bacterium]|nr:SgcJ/EcaC family oxidoreductase [Anaerolineae bacterium]
MSSISQETRVRKAVQSFYDAFNKHDFSRISEFTTVDWVHINPLGGWARGREAVLSELQIVHASFLRDVTDTPEEIDVRFASTNAAIVTVPSKMSPHTTPDGVRRENQKQIRTFILVKRANQWLIMQDQNTFREQ